MAWGVVEVKRVASDGERAIVSVCVVFCEVRGLGMNRR